MCERAAQCRSVISVTSCRKDCEASPGDLNDFRTEFIEDFTDCVHGLNCIDFFAEKAFVPCWDDARVRAKPSDETRTFCGERSRVWFGCGLWYFPDQCERDWALRTAASLEEVATCHEGVPCDELASCTNAVLGLTP
jgi:hypothetical protein